MSKIKPIVCGHQGFWGYDVAVGIFLKYLIDAAEADAEANTPWLSQAISDWRVQAVISDFQLTLGENWSAEQWAEVILLAEQACAALAARDSIPAEEIVSWCLLEDQDLRIFPRGARQVRTQTVVELGRAVIALLRSELPGPPSGEAWFFGAPEGRTTIRMEPTWDGRWR